MKTKRSTVTSSVKWQT